jgi:hypothetical protein
MANFLKSEKLRKTAKPFIFSWLVCLVFTPNSFSASMHRMVHATEIRWSEEYIAIIDGRVVDCAYSGGMEFCKLAFVDIDADGDLDIFVGEENGRISFFRNDGTKYQPRWSFISDFYDSIAVGEKSAPTFADINGDGDFDLFIGNQEGKIVFYQNDGNSAFPLWRKISDDYASIDVGDRSIPVFVDIDADLDLDLFIGEKGGNINFYRNDGTKQNPVWTQVTDNYYAIEAGDFSQPTFADIDADGDLDLFLGKSDGRIEFYRNEGSPHSPSWILVSDNYNGIDVDGYASPTFVDIDADSDLDLFIGQTYGKIFLYRNDGTPHNPFWTLVSASWNSFDVGYYSVPTSADLDLDGDFDLLVGNGDGKIWLFQNDGTPNADSFVFISDYYDSIDVGERNAPVLCDVDSDGDPDLFIGEADGGLHFYKNLTLNSIRGKVTDEENIPLTGVVVYLSGHKTDTTFTDSSGNYQFIGLSVGNYCVFRNPTIFQYCFTPLDSDVFDINFTGATDIDEEMDTFDLSPYTYHLYQNYPNPFNPTTTILFHLHGQGPRLDSRNQANATLKIYNIRGELVRTLLDEPKDKGKYETIWDGKTNMAIRWQAEFIFIS